MAQKLRLGYTVLDTLYANGSLQVIAGGDAESNGNFSSLQNPQNLDADIAATMADPVVFSYMNGTELRLILAKITSSAGSQPSTCTYTVLTPLVTTEAADVTLQSGTPATNVATNPHGIAEVGNWLYIVDYDNQAIYRIGKTELDGKTGNYTLANAPLDLKLGTAANLPDNAKGQAIIALKNGGTSYLFALFIVNNPTGSTYNSSILVRMTVDTSGGSTDGALTYVDQVAVGLNATEIIPVKNGTGVTLLIPAIGGMQQAGTTNEEDSIISAVDAFASSLSATTLLTGDPMPSSGGPTAYDIRAIAAPAPDNSVGTYAYILTGTFATGYTGTMWNLYEVKVSTLLSYTGSTLTAAGMATVDKGASAPGYFWDILYENGDANNVDRLWFLKGSPILVTQAGNYSTSDKLFPVGTGTGAIGGANVNSADLLAETIRQALAGVSLKRGLRGLAPHVKAAARKAAPLAEEKGKK